MLQFYFLSVLFNALAGFTLVFAADSRAEPEGESKGFLPPQNFRLVLGILTLGTGFFKLLTVIRGDVPVVGDLIPAVAGLCGGFSLLLEYFLDNSTTGATLNPTVAAVFINGKKYIGIFCLVAALLHFFFPTILFL